jgi:signal peptidase I
MGGFGFGALAATAALAALAAFVAVLRRRITVVAVIGPSMQPALAAGDRVLVRRAGISELRPGQIVVFEKPGNDGGWVTQPPRWTAGRREWMIKRVAAVPGDRLPDAILSAAAHPAGRSVPAGKLVVLGDNAARSLDSREIGYIPAERLLGVMLRPLAHR